MKVLFSSQNELNPGFFDGKVFELASFNQSFHETFDKINSNSILVRNFDIMAKDKSFNISDLYIAKDEKILSAKGKINIKPNALSSSLSATVGMSLNDLNILSFEVDMQIYDFNAFLGFSEMSKINYKFFDLLNKNLKPSGNKKYDLSLLGTFDLNSTDLNLQISDAIEQFDLITNIDLYNSFQTKKLLFGKTELMLGNIYFSSLDFNVDLSNGKFETNEIKLLKPSNNIPSF